MAWGMKSGKGDLFLSAGTTRARFQGYEKTSSPAAMSPVACMPLTPARKAQCLSDLAAHVELLLPHIRRRQKASLAKDQGKARQG